MQGHTTSIPLKKDGEFTDVLASVKGPIVKIERQQLYMMIWGQIL